MYVAEPAIFATRNGCLGSTRCWRSPASDLFRIRLPVGLVRQRANCTRGAPPKTKMTIAVTFAPPLCCRKPLTNSECAVVKGARVVDLATMKLSLLIAVCCTAALAANAQFNVTQKNNNPSRDGLYIDPAFTPGNAANLVRDLNFNGTIVGHVHAQPLYIEGGPNGPMIIAVTASNNIYALKRIGREHHLAKECRHARDVRSTLRSIQSSWHHWHACCRPRVAIPFLRRIDRWLSDQAFHFFVKCGYGRYECRLACGFERHG